MAEVRKSGTSNKSRRPPATTPEGRENQLVSLAVDLAEKQLSDGTASAMVLTHYLKLASTRNRLEQTKIEQENLLLKARSEAMSREGASETLYAEALQAFRGYQPTPPEEEAFD